MIISPFNECFQTNSFLLTKTNYHLQSIRITNKELTDIGIVDLKDPLKTFSIPETVW